MILYDYLWCKTNLKGHLRMSILDLDGYFWIPRTLISTCTDFQLNPFWGAWGHFRGQ